ncbi:hypothetical protein H9P43_002148 [Blastocladiella emersonii ATCC 22665]|nr:hypothetical protein H9P43_002148 [Blastocladiella emersonii ATCC 22665]
MLARSILRGAPTAAVSARAVAVARPAVAEPVARWAVQARFESTAAAAPAAPAAAAPAKPSEALVAKLKTDLKTAMRAKDSARSTVIRGILSDITYAEKSANPPKEYLSLVMAAHKRRLEAAKMFDEAGRADLAAKERAEAALLDAYLPRILSDDEARVRVHELCKELGVHNRKGTGLLMARVAKDEELSVVRKRLIVEAMEGYFAEAAGKA